MEKTQYDLCVEVLRRLDREGVLKHMVLVGSWCTLFYQDLFTGTIYRSTLKTRDMDLLIPFPSGMHVKIDVATLLKDLGFVVGFTGTQGFIRLEHPELIIEFLVPERGRPSAKPYPLPQLGLNAQALYFMDYLGKDTISIQVQGLSISVPQPARFALHKLVILNRRPSATKRTKDLEAARSIMQALLKSNRNSEIRDAFYRMPKRWQTQVCKNLADPIDAPVLAILKKE